MIKLDSYNYIVIGLHIRYLRHSPSGEPLSTIKESINELERLLSASNFTVSINGYNQLRDFGNNLQLVRLINTTEQATLNKIMGVVEQIIRAEAISHQIYILEPKRFNLTYLINEPSKIFSAGVYEKLPNIGRYDFEEGFKCIAFARPTAAAFHILRGTEDVLKNLLYFKKIIRGREKKPMWGNMVEGLRKKKKSNIDPVLLDTLDYIRKNYRNPTDHPEEIYDLDKVQDLLGVCLEVVNKIAKLK